MSNWTHVAGVIRIDALSRDFDFDNVIGKEVHFNDQCKIWNDAEDHPEKYLPLGSEGSLQKVVWENPKLGQIAAYTVTIFGDLRDHDDPHKIVEWFKGICSKLAVRDAVIVVRNERNGQVVWADEQQIVE